VKQLEILDGDLNATWQFRSRRLSRRTLRRSSSRRSRRGPLSVARFKAIGRLVWSRANGLEDDGYWENRASG